MFYKTVTLLCGLPSCFSFLRPPEVDKNFKQNEVAILFFLEPKVPDSFFFDGYCFQRKSNHGKTIQIKCAVEQQEKDTLFFTAILHLFE